MEWPGEPVVLNQSQEHQEAPSSHCPIDSGKERHFKSDKLLVMTCWSYQKYCKANLYEEKENKRNGDNESFQKRTLKRDHA